VIEKTQRLLDLEIATTVARKIAYDSAHAVTIS
jgi:hypothetical protein